MGKYAHMKRFHYDHKFHFYMYDIMYVDYDTMAEEYYFWLPKYLLQSTREGQLQEQSQNIGFDLVTYVQNIISLIYTFMYHK